MKKRKIKVSENGHVVERLEKELNKLQDEGHEIITVLPMITVVKSKSNILTAKMPEAVQVQIFVPVYYEKE